MFRRKQSQLYQMHSQKQLYEMGISINADETQAHYGVLAYLIAINQRRTQRWWKKLPWFLCQNNSLKSYVRREKTDRRQKPSKLTTVESVVKKSRRWVRVSLNHGLMIWMEVFVSMLCIGSFRFFVVCCEQLWVYTAQNQSVAVSELSSLRLKLVQYFVSCFFLHLSRRPSMRTRKKLQS